MTQHQHCYMLLSIWYASQSHD